LPEKLVEELEKDGEWVKNECSSITLIRFYRIIIRFWEVWWSMLGMRYLLLRFIRMVTMLLLPPPPTWTRTQLTPTQWLPRPPRSSHPDPATDPDAPDRRLLRRAGLFAITLSPYLESTTGIELPDDLIENAERNARINELIFNEKEGGEKKRKVEFRAGDASGTFDSLRRKPTIPITTSEEQELDVAADADSNLNPDPENKWLFPPFQIVLLIDPPRKGCHDVFLRQLIEFGAGRVVHVSCNVHTQARDVGWILRQSVVDAVGGGEGGEKRKKRKKYVLESLRGFDLFLQTAHVESVAVLRLVDY
jgi:tRNA (uracil-5-)-methyltransferase